MRLQRQVEDTPTRRTRQAAKQTDTNNRETAIPLGRAGTLSVL